jgi:hypothetical protein
MIEMSEALSIINAHMHEGRCPTAGCIGECAAMTEIRPGIWWAALYIWDKEFNDSTRVAKWFTDIGATDILITHVLHDTDNVDKDGKCFDEARAWHVEFAMSWRAALASVMNEVTTERKRQDMKFGGPDADDSRKTPEDWCNDIEAYIVWARHMHRMDSPERYRRRVMQVAALAVAACESYDRKAVAK